MERIGRRVAAVAKTEPVFLRRVLLADAAVCGAAGLALLAGAGPLGRLLGLPDRLLGTIGPVLLPWAASLGYLSTRPTVSRSATRVVVGINLAWTAASLVLLASGRVEPTALGAGFVVLQALGVATFGGLQVFGLRQVAMNPTRCTIS